MYNSLFFFYSVDAMNAHLIFKQCSHYFNRLFSVHKSNPTKCHASPSVAKLFKEQDTSNKLKDTVFVRHAHSEFNRAC